MGLKISYEQLNDPELMNAIKILDISTSLPLKEIMNFNKIKGVIEKKTAEAREIFKKLIEKHAETEAVKNGDRIITRPKLGSDGEPAFKDRKAFEIELKEFMLTTFDVDADKMDLNYLDMLGLTPAQFRALSPLTGGETWKTPQPLPKKVRQHGNQKQLSPVP